MRSVAAALSAGLNRQAARLVHFAWLGVVVAVAGLAPTPLTGFDLTLLAAAALPGALGLVLGGALYKGRDAARLMIALAWTAPGFAACAGLGSALSPAALAFLVGPAALAAAGLRDDVRLSALISSLAFALAATASLAGPLGGGAAAVLADNPGAGLALATFFALAGFVARVRLLSAADKAAARAKALSAAAAGFEYAPAPMLALDAEGRITAASRGVRRLTPGAPRDLAGLPADGLAFDDAGRDALEQGLESARHGGAADGGHFTFPVRAADGARTGLEARAVQTPGGYVVAFQTGASGAADRDRTRLEAERDAAIAASRSKSEFLAAVSHELRTPLNAIIGFSDIIKQRLFGPLPARYAEYGDLIHESGEHLLELIGDVLDMSKIEADRYQLAPEAFDARDVVSICAKMIRPRAQDRGIALYCETGDEALPVEADRKAMRQILLNLLSNAVKFTPEGGAIVVMARRDGDALVLAVGDSGVGIAEDELALIGQPYQQTRSGRETSERGTGLGLSLVRALTEMQDGEMSVTSAAGEGTTVTIRLPVLASAHVAPASDPAPLEVHQRIAAAQQAGETIVKVNGGAA